VKQVLVQGRSLGWFNSESIAVLAEELSELILGRPDPFHETTKMLLEGPPGPSAGTRGVPFALDSTARVEALRRTGAFDLIEQRNSAWVLELDPERTVALYATFSELNARQDRQAVLTEPGRIARYDFQGRATRNMTTSLYIARRCT
jgi:hypothetical protein